MHLSSIIALALCSAAAATQTTLSSVTVSPITIGVVPTKYELVVKSGVAAAVGAGKDIVITAAPNTLKVFKTAGLPTKAATITIGGVETCGGSTFASTATTLTITLKEATGLTCSIPTNTDTLISVASGTLEQNPTTPATIATVTMTVKIDTDDVSTGVNYVTGLQVTNAAVTPSTYLAGAQVTKLDVSITPTTALADKDTITVSTASTTTVLVDQATAFTVAVPDSTKCTATGSTATAAGTRTLTITLANAAGAVCAVPNTGSTVFSVSNGLGVNPATGNVVFNIATSKDKSEKSAQYAVTSGTVGRHVFSSFAVVVAFIMSVMHTLA